MKAFENYRGLLYLILLLIVLPIAAWRLAIGETLDMWLRTGKIQKQADTIEAIAPQNGSLPTDIAQYEECIRSGLLLSEITQAAEQHKAAVIRYTPYVNENSNGLLSQSAEISLSGGYKDIVRVIEQIEKSGMPYRLESVNFNTVRNRQDRRAQLTATLIIRQITLI